VQGRAIRFGPSRDGVLAASMWKVWAEGSEVYATARGPGGSAKISVHASGQIHYRLEPKLKQDLAPLAPLPSGVWHHAFELRFLIGDGALVPFGVKESLKNKPSYVVSISNGSSLLTNLIIGPPGIPDEMPLPPEFSPDGVSLWKTRLRDGRLAVLVGRVLQLNAENRAHIDHIRKTVKPTISFKGKPQQPYIEVFHLHWSAEGGNVVLAIPLGSEAIRNEEEDLPADVSTEATRDIDFHSPGFVASVRAPDGAEVATVELTEARATVQLIKGVSRSVEAGQLNLRLRPNNLIAGSAFTVAPFKVAGGPAMSGASLNKWAFSIASKFDGTRLSIELRQNSGAIQNRNLPTPVAQLGDNEELVIAMPEKNLSLSAATDAPTSSENILARLTLRGRR